jgi:acyl carrier protein
MQISINELLILISRSLDVSRNKINIKSKSEELSEWDSLGQLEIITSLDKKFEGNIDFEKLSTIKDVKGIIAFLKKKNYLV